MSPFLMRVFRCGVLGLLISLTGCQLPNLTPFADASVELRKAIVESGAATVQSMKAVPKTNSPGGAVDLANLPADDTSRLATIWNDRLKAMDVLVGYADALAGITAAGNESQATADSLGDSLIKLASYVPVGGAAVDAGINLATILVRTGIQIKSFHDLHRAVNEAHMALMEVGKYLQQDLIDLRILYWNASLSQEDALDKEFNFDKLQYDRGKLLGLRAELRTRYIEDHSDANFVALSNVEQLVSAIETEHSRYQERRGAILAQRAAAFQAFSKARDGVQAWLDAHEELRTALKANRRPNVRLILSTSQEIKDAVDRLKNASD